VTSMQERSPPDLGATLAGVRLPFCAMNAAGVGCSTTGELRDLALSEVGAIVMRTATVHPFVHPQYRSLHNPGYDKLLPLVRELAARDACPVVASIAGTRVEELSLLARAFGEAGAALVEANLADPYVTATLGPFETPEALHALLARLAAESPVPVMVKLPERPAMPYAVLGAVLEDTRVRVVVIKNDFAGFEKLLVEAGRGFDVVVAGGIRTGYDVSRAIAKGARAVQVDSALALEGPGVFARLAREILKRPETMSRGG
jgi:dihydroorotate dehydrogenase (fumarate)